MAQKSDEAPGKQSRDTEDHGEPEHTVPQGTGEETAATTAQGLQQ